MQMLISRVLGRVYVELDGGTLPSIGGGTPFYTFLFHLGKQRLHARARRDDATSEPASDASPYLGARGSCST